MCELYNAKVKKCEKIGKSMSTGYIQYKLREWLADFGNIAVPNYKFDRFEADVLELTSENSICEYEIKKTLQDFNLDFKKSAIIKGHHYTKMDLISMGKRVNRFYFVTAPNFNLSLDKLPKHAGLIRAYINDFGNLKFQKIKEAPNLTELKVGEVFLRDILFHYQKRYSQLIYQAHCCLKNKKIKPHSILEYE